MPPAPFRISFRTGGAVFHVVQAEPKKGSPDMYALMLDVTGKVARPAELPEGTLLVLVPTWTVRVTKGYRKELDNGETDGTNEGDTIFDSPDKATHWLAAMTAGTQRLGGSIEAEIFDDYGNVVV